MYLSQTKSDLHKIVRVYSCGCPKMIIKPLQSRIPPLLPFSPSSPPLSCQSNLLILNISAKSSHIFTKFSGYIPVGVPKMIIKPLQSRIPSLIPFTPSRHFFPPPSCQSNLLILDISAKSSQIFTKC